MFLSNKIVYGYAIALCITCLGTATGLLLGNYYHQESLQKSQTVSQEHQSLKNLQLDILYNCPAKQLSPYLKDPQGFRRESVKLLESIQTTLTILEIHNASGKFSKVERLEPLLKEYQVFLREFKQESQDLIERLDRLTASPKTFAEVESQLLKFFKSKNFLRFVELPDRLTPFIETVSQHQKEANYQLDQAKVLRIQISITGLLVSVAIAALFIKYISHAIAVEQANNNQKLQDQLVERQQTEARLLKSEAHQSAIISALPDMIIRMNREGFYSEFITNPIFPILGVPKDHVGTHMSEILPPDIAKQRMDYIQLTLQTNSIQIYEQILSIDGKEQVEEVRIVPYSEDEVLLLVRDISDRKQAEASLERELRRSEMLFNSSLDGLFVLDLEGKTIEANQSFASMLGYSLEEVMTLSIYDIDAKWTTEELKKGVREFGQDKRVKFETLHRRKDGSLCTVEISASSVNWADEIVQFAICRDITARKQAELQLHQLNQSLESKVRERTAELQQTNEELIRATRLKDEFLANMSHELRTPLNTILGMTDGLEEQVYGNLNERQLQALRTVERSGSHLLELINDILDLAKIESGQIDLECTDTSINLLCQSSLAFIKQQALQKSLQLEMKIPLNLPSLFVDERRIRQVLINLLNNAVKFTPKGGRVNLEVTQLPPNVATSDRPLLKYLRISVIDTGIGISPENIKKLFQPFIQIDSALNRQYQGTGLGLALVKRIVELHNGRVGITSELGVGSCFTVDLPHDFPSEIFVSNQPETTLCLDSPTTNQTAGQSPLILLVEDNEANIITTMSYLEAKLYRVLLAKNGQDAIAIAKAHQPDIILMDIQMPVMDGIEATKQIRLDPNLANIPIIAMTALAMAGDRDRCLAAGATEYLSKPVKLKQLVIMIQALLQIYV